MTLENSHPYTQLTPDRVIDAVESLGYLSDVRILPMNSYENRVYQVGIEGQKPLIAKFYRPGRWSRQQILEEHQFSRILAEGEFPIVAPTENEHGETLFEFEGFHFSLFKRMGGHSPELDNPDHLTVLGRCMGRLHALGAAENFRHRPTITLERYVTENVSWLLENDFIPDSLRVAYETLTRDLLDRLETIGSRYQVNTIRVHGDAHVGNILWRDDHPHFVDFDDTCMAPAIQDLWMFLSGDRASQTAQLCDLLEGYEDFFSFDLIELNLVEYFRTLRLVNYAGWLAKRWEDPAFPRTFTWFNTERYWSEHILELREQLANLDEPPLSPQGV